MFPRALSTWLVDLASLAALELRPVAPRSLAELEEPVLAQGVLSELVASLELVALAAQAAVSAAPAGRAEPVELEELEPARSSLARSIQP